jgi:hypothetical protein
MPISPVFWHAGLRQCAPGRRGATCSAPLASWWRPALAGVLSAASAPSWRHLAVIAFVFGPGCGTDNCGRKSTLSRCSSKPLLSGFVRRAIDRHSQYQSIFFIAPDLDGDELAQEGAEGPGILRSDRKEVLSATEDAESPHDRLANVNTRGGCSDPSMPSSTANATSLSAASTKLKHFRRIPTCFEKLARNYLAAVLLASRRLWIRLNESTPSARDADN